MAADPYHSRGWRQVRVEVLERDGWVCQIRGPKCVGHANHADHIIPWQEGGAWLDKANLRAACGPCNTARGAARMHAMAKLNRQPAVQPSRDW